MTVAEDSPSDHYAVLGVVETADQQSIRKAYLAAARRWHPDNFSSDDDVAQLRLADQKMQEINQAWQVLSVPELKRSYDASRVGINVSKIRIDSQYLYKQRVAQQREIDHKHGLITRVVPAILVAVLLIAALFVGASNSFQNSDPVTVEMPDLGAGITGGDCVSLASGPSLQELPCGPIARWRVIGAHDGLASCPLEADLSYELSNGFVACLDSIGESN